MAREIPQAQWSGFLTDFTFDHEGQRATIQVDGRHIGAEDTEDRFVFTGVEAGVQAEEPDTIVIELADMEGREQSHVTHRLEDVQAVRVLEEEGRVMGLAFDTRDGTHAELRLGAPVPVTRE